MPLVGPTLPPGQAQKRKRDDQDDSDETDLRSPRSSKGGSASPASSVKKARTVGPTLPPAPLDERAPQPPNSDKESSSDDDDDFGPNLPTETPQSTKVPSGLSTASTNAPQPPASAKSQRDEWMIVPPSSGDWSSRVDPTKLKNRKFNTAKGAKGQGQTTGKESNTKWTETPDEKRARLQREMMGVKEISAAKDSPEDDAKARENAKKLREYNVRVMCPLSSPLHS